MVMFSVCVVPIVIVLFSVPYACGCNCHADFYISSFTLLYQYHGSLSIMVVIILLTVNIMFVIVLLTVSCISVLC